MHEKKVFGHRAIFFVFASTQNSTHDPSPLRNKPMELHVPECMVPSLDDVEAMVQRWREETAPHEKQGQQKHVEIEARLGLVQRTYPDNKTRFVNGVTAEFFATVLAMFGEFKEWDLVETEHMSKDSFYVLADKRRIRTTTFYEEGKDPRVSHVCKNGMSTLDLEWKGRGTTRPHGVADVRIALAVEEPVDPPPDLGVLVDPVHVRYKMRQSYTCRHWRFDMTRSWTGNSDAVMHTSTPTYEIEMELVAGEALLSDSKHSNKYVALSLLHRVCGLYSVNETTYVLAPARVASNVCAEKGCNNPHRSATGFCSHHRV